MIYPTQIKQMENQNYNCAFVVKNPAQEVYESICRVPEWWTINTEGNSKKINDAFTIHFGETRVDFKIVEIIPNKKIVWLVTDCFLHWLDDKTEWKNTKLTFEI